VWRGHSGDPLALPIAAAHPHAVLMPLVASMSVRAGSVCLQSATDGILTCLDSAIQDIPLRQPFALPCGGALSPPPLDISPSQSPSASATASLSNGASPSETSTSTPLTTATSSASAPYTLSTSPSQIGTPTSSRTPTSSLTLRASASTTESPTLTPTFTPTSSRSPYCSVQQYVYYSGHDVTGSASLGAASVSTERDCARACCDVPLCDAYAFANGILALGASQSNCFFVGNVTHVFPSRAFSVAVNVRAL
jgi:hypothetical protein